MENIKIRNGKNLIHSQVLLQTDASKRDGGAVCKGIQTGSQWSANEQVFHINYLELLAIKLAILTFTRMFEKKSFHLQAENKVALVYLLKMGGTASLGMCQLSKEIWEHLMHLKITITAEYLPSALNTVADW